MGRGGRTQDQRDLIDRAARVRQRRARRLRAERERRLRARGIERRLVESGRLPKLPQRELAARSSALAGSLLSLLRWWLDRGAKEKPRAMDEMFHKMVWSGLQ